MSYNRNEPCPCGSGLKFKKCHLGKEKELPGYQPPTNKDGQAIGKKPVPRNVLYGLIATIILAAATLAFMGYADWAVAGGGGGLILLGAFVILRDPPPPNKDGSDPSGINFGK